MNQNANTTTQVCYVHPNRETMLRCNRCDRPICTECAVLTETGYRCKECVRGQQRVFDTAQWFDYPLAFVVGGVLSFLGSLISSYLGFFTIFIAPVAGVIIAEGIRAVIGRRRSRLLFQIATLGTILGGLLIPFGMLTGMMLFGRAGVGGLLSLLWPGIYLFLVASTTYYRLSGIQIR